MIKLECIGSLDVDRPSRETPLLQARARIERMRKILVKERRCPAKDAAAWADAADLVATMEYDVNRYTEDIERIDKRRVGAVATIARLKLRLIDARVMHDALSERLGLNDGNSG